MKKAKAEYIGKFIIALESNKDINMYDNKNNKLYSLTFNYFEYRYILTDKRKNHAEFIDTWDIYRYYID